MPIINVIYVIARLSVGGATSHLISLQTGLDPARFRSLLVTGRENPGEGSMVEFALSRGVRRVLIPEIVAEATLKPRDVRALLKLYRLMRRERPHIVHTHTAKAGFLGRLAARLAGVPVVVHTFHGHILHGYYSPLKSWLLRRMEQALASLSDRLIAVSAQVRQDLVAYGVAPPEKMTVIPLGLEMEPFLDAPRHRGAFRRELGLSDGARLVGIVGRLFPIKNHRLFLEAAASVSAEEPTVRFVVVGDGPLRPELERQAERLGLADRVFFSGWRGDLATIYADLDVLAVSSNNEGTPVAAIEAMAAGCPVVATCVGGMPDLISDGNTGFLVPPGEPGALASAILRVVRNPETADAMARTARDVVRECFSEKRLIDDMEKLYQELLAGTCLGDHQI